MDKIKNKKVDVKDLKRLKKEKKKLKEAEIIAKLEKTKTLQATLAAKPVPKARKLDLLLKVNVCLFSRISCQVPVKPDQVEATRWE